MATGIGGGVNFTATMIKTIPIPEMSQNEIKLLEKLSIDIISIVNQTYFFDDSMKQKKIKILIEKVDQIIYQLYGLTDNEIKIVENFKSKKN